MTCVKIGDYGKTCRSISNFWCVCVCVLLKPSLFHDIPLLVGEICVVSRNFGDGIRDWQLAFIF